MINVETIYGICGVFNSLNIKFFVSLNVIFLFLDTLICALKTEVNITHSFKGNVKRCLSLMVKDIKMGYKF
jgi:hypothetical protein